MVARFISGKSIAGALRYNEDKVKKEKAKCIGAVGYPLDKEHLDFTQKLARLEHLAALNERVKVNCVHISLNFDPSEKLNDDKLLKIADAYTKRIGFEGQPYLVYRHFDAAHPHIHILTTNIKSDGKRIALHNIGRNQSEEARKEIEKIFGLVQAESRKKSNELYLKPIPAEKAWYGQLETKASISNIVREVIREWKFTSLAEYNAILKQYNVIADNGKEDSRMREKGGLVYLILDGTGEPVGVPIKASSIYTKPTISKLQSVFEKNKEQRKPYRYRIKNCIDKAIASDEVNDKTALKESLAKEGIKVVYRENEDGRIYGVTLVDLKAKVVFNGSDLGKAYSALNLLKRMDSETKAVLTAQNLREKEMSEMLKEIDYTKGFASVLSQLYGKGIIIRQRENTEGEIVFSLASRQNPKAKPVPVGRKMTAYLLANGYSQHMEAQLQKQISNSPGLLPSMAFLESWIAGLLKSEVEYSNFSVNWKKKKKKRKSNW